MPRPTCDPSTGWWSIRFNTGNGDREKVMLAKHPGWRSGQSKPRKAPDFVERMAREHQLRRLRIKQGLEADPGRPLDLDAFHAAYRKVWLPGKARATVVAFDRAWSAFLAFCAREKVATAQAVTAAVCRSFLAERRAIMAHSTVRLERGLIGRAWRQAARDGTIPGNPWPLESVPGRARQERPDYWEPAELALLLGACDPWSRDVATLGVNTGLRAENLLELEWAEVRLAEGRIAIPAARMKSGKPLSLPLNPAARSLLGRLAEHRRGPLVFPRPNGADGPAPLHQLRRRLIRARVRAGLPAKPAPLHILRHTFATLAIRAGVPLPIVQQWLGHSSIVQTMRYVHVSEAESARQMEAFGGVTSPWEPSSGGPASGPS